MTDLEDQTVVVSGGSAGIGLETARPAASRTGSAMGPILSNRGGSR